MPSIIVIQVVAAGANPVLITRGIEKTTKALVSELKAMSKEVILMLTLFFFVCTLLFKGNIMSVPWDCRLKTVNLQM